MPIVKEDGGAPGDVMVVDDTPANLKLLEDMLNGQGYKVRSFPRGRMALAASLREPPELVLLDINMPEMDGYEVCRQLKANPATAQVPVIFLSALSEVGDKLKGFRCGGADYVSKPFQLEEIQARVDVQIKLGRARLAEQELLEHTLSGAVRVLAQLVQLVSPGVAARTQALQHIVRHLISELKPPAPWRYDLAATLAMIGCITVPDDAFERGYIGEFANREEEEVFRAHPNNGATLLLNIPRLEAVAEMIRGQLDPALPAVSSEAGRLGARILNLALNFDRRSYRGLSPSEALHDLKAVPGQFDPAMLDALASYQVDSTELQFRSVLVKDLRAGMILEDDIVSAASRLTILRKGTVLNSTWLERIRNFGRSQGVSEPVRVQVPTLRL